MSDQPRRIFLSGIHLWKGSEWERLTTDNPDTDPITIKPEAVSHMAEQSSWVPLPSALHWRPIPIKALALSAHVSPLTVHFWVDKSLLSGPGRSLPSCNRPGLDSSRMQIPTLLLIWRASFLFCVPAWVCAQSCLTLCDPTDYSLPGSSICGILQEYWSGLPFPSPGESSRPRDQTQVSCLAGRFLLSYGGSTWESPCSGKAINKT